MSANKEKTSIRLKKVYQRLAKTRYSVNPIFRKLIKKHEQIESLTRWENFIWKNLYSAGFDPTIKDEKWSDQLSQISMIMDDRTKLYKSIDKIQSRHQTTLEQAQQEHYLINTGRLSQSY